MFLEMATLNLQAMLAHGSPSLALIPMVRVDSNKLVI